MTIELLEASSHEPSLTDSTRTLCTFRLADLHLGIDVSQVQEVLRGQEVTRIPLVAPVLAGLINLRGEIVTAIDLRRRLDLEPRADGAMPMNVIIRSSDGPVSLLVDEIDEVVEAPASRFEPPPPTLAEARRKMVTGVFKIENGLLLLLDLDRVLDLSDLTSVADSSPTPTPLPSPTQDPTPQITESDRPVRSEFPQQEQS